MNTYVQPSSSKATFSIALVNYKTCEMTKTCLELLQKHLVNTNVPVWVVDNNSADESTAYLRSLPWINLIERVQPEGELGHIAHGKALDMILERVDTDYILLMHTDTFIFDDQVFKLMLDLCTQDPKVAAVGCVEQLDRGLLRTSWRFCSRYCKHHYRRMLQALGVQTTWPAFLHGRTSSGLYPTRSNDCFRLFHSGNFGPATIQVSRSYSIRYGRSLRRLRQGPSPQSHV
jgi:hypothetical protein